MNLGASMRDGWPSAGVLLAPAAWALNTQINYAIVPWVCHSGMNIVPAIAVVNAAIALIGGFLSFRAWSARANGSSDDARGGRPHSLVAALGALMAVLFAAVILLQGTAGLVFQGCER